MSDRIGRAVRLVVQRIRISRRTRTLHRIATRAVDALVVLSLLIPALPTNAAPSTGDTATSTAASLAPAAVLESAEYQPPVFTRPEPRRAHTREVLLQDPDPTPTPTPEPSPTETSTPPGDMPPTLEIPPLPFPEAGESPREPFRLLSGLSMSPPRAPGWSLPRNLSQTEALSDWPALTVDNAGRVHAVWADGPIGTREVYYSSNAAGSWSSPVNVSSSPSVDSVFPDIAVDSSGGANIVWQDGYYGDPDIEIRYTRCAGGACTPPVDLSNGNCSSWPGDWQSWTPSVVYGDDGLLTVTWASNEPGGMRLPTLRWTPPGPVPTGITTCMPYSGAFWFPDLAAGSAGQRRVVVEDFQAGTISHAMYSLGYWSALRLIGSGSTPSLLIHPDGRSHIIWCIGGAVRYRFGDGAGAWSPVEDIAAEPACGGRPTLAVRADGLVHAVWEGRTYGVQILQSVRQSTGWTSPESVSQSPGSGEDPALASDAAGNLHALWADSRTGEFDIFYSLLPLGVVVSEEAVVTTDGEACSVINQEMTQGTAGGPINTRTGGYDYAAEDLSFTTSAGPLTFSRSYASLSVDTHSIPLGRGWTHSQASHLIFPADPGGETGAVLFQADTANRVRYVDNGDGTFSPGPGVCGRLARYDDPTVTYTVTDQAQSAYVFDTAGALLTRADAQGHQWAYSYDGDGRLARVSADGGSRFITLVYDGVGRLSSVTDHTGRQVHYAYDDEGNLSIVSDVFGNDWLYHYDTEHHLTEVTNPRGLTEERTEFDSQGRAVRQFDGLGNIIVDITYNPDGTSTLVDAAGNSRSHAYDTRKTITTETDALGGASHKVYDPNFRPAAVTDEAGDTTYLTWSLDGANLLQVTDAEGGVTDLEYDTLNNLTSVTDTLGFLTTYEYSGTLLTSSTDALDGTTTYTYTPEGYLESVTDPRGSTTSYTYDSFGQRTSMTDALGHTTTYTYDDLGRLIDSTNPLGHVTRSEYDAAGRLIRSIRNYDPGRPQNDENQYNIVTEYYYDQRGNQLWVMDTYGRRTYSEYDADDHLIRTIDVQGHETTNAYDDTGRLVSTTDALGRTTTYEYDDVGRLTATTDSLGGTTSSTYNLDGTLASTTDALGRTTTYAYDSLKRVIAVTDALGGVTQTTYDAAGNVASTTDALGETTTFEYDALNRVIRQTDAEGGVTEHFYDEAGNRIQTVDPLGHRTTYVYNGLNQMTAVADHLGYTTEYAYDDAGNRTSTTDGNGNSTTYTYDALGRVVATTDALGNASHSEYDALGNVLARTDANGHATTFEYDSLGRLVHQTNAEGGVTSYTYDAVGNQLTVTDPNDHTTTTVYDELNRPVSVTDANGIETTRSYDAGVNLVASTDGLGAQMTFGYDALNRQVAVTDPLGNATSYGYDARGNRTSMIDAEGVVTRYEYDGLGRLTAVLENYVNGAGSDAETNVRTEYGYDAAGNRLSIRDGNGHVTAFAYNAVKRLASETDALGHETTYVYDAVGNRTLLTDANGVSTTYVYDEANRLTAILYPPPEPSVSFAYDDAGNRISMTDNSGQTTWEYDGLNRPTAITSEETGRVGYGYDAVGNRTSLTYPDGKFVSFAYDPGSRMTGVTAWDSTITTYTYDAANRLTITSLPNGVVSSYTYDQGGRLLELAHARGTEVLSSFGYAYDAVGNRVQAVEHLAMPGGGPTIPVTVTDTSGTPLPGLTVYAFSGDTYSGYSRVTDAAGVATITLPAGDYRFRVDVDGTQFWSGPANHCPIPGCFGAVITVPPPVLVSVTDTQSAPMQGLPVYAFSGGVSSGYQGTTDENGQVSLRLPQGAYRFRADSNGTQFWSSAEEDCSVPGCTLATITVTLPVEVTVQDSFGVLQPGLPVYAFSGGSYTGYSATTDENGLVSVTLPEGSYRFRADLNGTQFWSGTDDHCVIPGCEAAVVNVTVPVSVQVWQWDTGPLSGIPVYAFQGTTYTGYHAETDDAGFAMLTLPEGSYHFRADVSGTEYWDSTEDSCPVPGCEETYIDVPRPVVVTVQDTDLVPQEGLTVYAFEGSTYAGFSATTNAEGQASLQLPIDSYRFRADRNGTQFWSGEINHCDVPPCDAATVTVTIPVEVTVVDGEGQSQTGIPVYAFDGSTYTGHHGTSDEDGRVVFTLPVGDYRFRADVDGTQFWSGEANHCDVPGCLTAFVTISLPGSPTATPEPTSTPTLEPTPTDTPEPTPTQVGYLGGGNALALPVNLLGRWLVPAAVERPAPAAGELLDLSPVAVTVQDTDGAPQAGLPVYAFNGPAYTGYSATTNSSGIATLSLPDGDYRFRSDLNGTQFWSGGENHCTVPGCESSTVVVTIPVTVTVLDTDSQPVQGLSVYAFNGTAYTGFSRTTSALGEAVFTLPQGSYRFRADRNGTQFWSGTANHCDIPGCTSAVVTVTIPLVVTVRSTGGTPQAGLPVYAFNGATYTGYSRTTDASGEAVFTLPQGSYRFRSDRAGTQFWSGEANHCDVPGCLAAEVVVTLPVTVTVLDNDGNPQAGLPIYAFDGDTYTGFSGTTDDLGEVPFTLPEGSYRFRADLLGTQFWSDEVNHCDVPGCEDAFIEVTSPLVVTVLDTDGAPKEDLPVYAFDDDTYTGFNASTNASGEVTFVLPIGSYRFRADLNGTQFWSGEANHCDIPGCVAASVTVTIPVTVSVQDQAGTPYPDLPVYAFTGETYTGFNGTSNAEGEVIFTLPIGDYRFRTDLDGVQFWSGETTTCTIPGCIEDLVPIPGGTVETDVTIDYTYDPLYRLTAADYSTGEYFHYTYDAVGNRLTQETGAGTNTYTYDIANRLTSVDGVAHTWDANGNLLTDGASTYSYDPANRLRTVDQGDTSYTFMYDGLGNRVSQIVSGGSSYDYTLDLAAGLTQVLDDGTNTYLYGRARLGEQQPEGWQYHLGDALGSVRELTNSTGTVGLVRSYEPFGSLMASFGSGSTAFAFTGEQLDGTGLAYLRARYVDSFTGRFLSQDSRIPDYQSPPSLNPWTYVEGNPVNATDPSGLVPKRNEIGWNFIYSCNCGWIDFAHANPTGPRGILRLLESRPTPPSTTQVREDIMALSLRVELPLLSFLHLSKTAVFRTGLSETQVRQVALGMFMEREEMREWYQSLPVVSQVGRSGYSEEDLASDLIGFYMALRDYGDVRNGTTVDEQSAGWLWLSRVCGFPADLGRAIEWSERVYDTYPAFQEGASGIREWGAPRLACTEDIATECTGRRSWPGTLATVIPQDPLPQSDWWLYSPLRELIDGQLVASSEENLYFLYRPWGAGE